MECLYELQALRWLVVLLSCCAGACATRSNGEARSEDALLDRHVADLRATVAGPVDAPRPRVLLLGTFHFANPGADAHKPKYTFDVFSAEGQRELAEILDRLAEYRPTKILVERASRDQDKVDEWYASYLAGKQEKVSNEIVTIGFALAKRLGHDRVWAFDTRGEWLPTAPETSEKMAETAKRLGKEAALRDPTEARYFEMYKQSDEIEETLTLRQRLRLLNHPENLRLNHGAYLVGAAFGVANGTEFPGPDGFTSMWHNRNLRMFSNIQRLASEPDDRLLVIVGAGHVPILQHCAQCCPRMEWVALDQYLRAR